MMGPAAGGGVAAAVLAGVAYGSVLATSTAWSIRAGGAGGAHLGVGALAGIGFAAAARAASAPLPVALLLATLVAGAVGWLAGWLNRALLRSTADRPHSHHEVAVLALALATVALLQPEPMLSSPAGSLWFESLRGADVRWPLMPATGSALSAGIVMLAAATAAVGIAGTVLVSRVHARWLWLLAGAAGGLTAALATSASGQALAGASLAGLPLTSASVGLTVRATLIALLVGGRPRAVSAAAFALALAEALLLSFAGVPLALAPLVLVAALAAIRPARVPGGAELT